jgi:hypothetical protein
MIYWAAGRRQSGSRIPRWNELTKIKREKERDQRE